MGFSFSKYLLPGRTVRTNHVQNLAADHSKQQNKPASNATQPSEGARKPPILGIRRWTSRFRRRTGPQLTSREWHGKSSLNGNRNIDLVVLTPYLAVTALYHACKPETAVLKGLLADIETVLKAHGAIAEKGDSDFKSLAYAFSRAYKHLFVQHDMRDAGNRSKWNQLSKMLQMRIPVFERADAVPDSPLEQQTSRAAPASRGPASATDLERAGRASEIIASACGIHLSARDDALPEMKQRPAAENAGARGEARSAMNRPVPEAIRPGTPPDHARQLREYLIGADGEGGSNAKLENWLRERLIEVVPNSGSNNSCLIHSMLQHVTGAYSVSTFDDSAWRNLVGEQGMLYFDTPNVANMLDRMNAEHGTSVRILFVMSQADGTPIVIHTLGTGKNPAVIWHQGLHYVALRMVENWQTLEQERARKTVMHR